MQRTGQDGTCSARMVISPALTQTAQANVSYNPLVDGVALGPHSTEEKGDAL
jgi:hypothetical protein